VSTKKQKLMRKKFRDLIPPFFAVCIVLQLLPLLQVSVQASVESDFMAMLNAERVTLGKNPIIVNSCLETAAYLHSQDVAEQNYFSHTSLDGRTFDERIIAAGYTEYVSLAENIAYSSGEPDATRVYDMWKNSAGHYANMMGDFNEAGLGVYSKNGFTYYTLDLGKSRNVSPAPSPSPTPSPQPSPTVAVTPTPNPTDAPSPIPTATPTDSTPTSSPQSENANEAIAPEAFYVGAAIGGMSIVSLLVWLFDKQRQMAQKR
jgi:cell division septation protein DedD